MASFNQIVLVGNLVGDPTLRYLSDGTPIASARLAVNNPFSKKEKKTLFIDLDFWRKQAEIVTQYCKRGNNILVTGRLENDTWEKEGQIHSKMKVVVNDFQILTPKSTENNAQPEENLPTNDIVVDNPKTDIPF